MRPRKCLELNTFSTRGVQVEHEIPGEWRDPPLVTSHEDPAFEGETPVFAGSHNGNERVSGGKIPLVSEALASRIP